MTLSTGYTDREKAIRAEIEKQCAPTFQLKYVTDFDGITYAAFDFGGNPKGFTTTSKSVFDIEPKEPSVIAAQIVAAAKSYDTLNWPAP